MKVMEDTNLALQQETEELRARLAEAEETLEAIRTGQVDAVVVRGPEGHAVYTLTGAERVYRLLVEAMNEGALVLAPDGSIIYSNHRFAAMLGLPLEHVIGSSVYQHIADQDVGAVRELLTDAIWTPGRSEISFRKDDATQVPAHISLSSLDVENEAESISAVVTDLTEHKALECELERYRQHLEDLVEQRTMQLKEAVDNLRVEIEARKTAEETLATSNEELANTNEELSSINDELQSEIAHRKQAEAVLRDTQADLKRAQSVAHVGSWRVDVRGHELSWSDETYNIFGVPAGTPMSYEEFLSKVHPDDRERVDNAWRSSLQGAPFDTEYRILTPEAEKWVHATAELERDEDGNGLGGFGTVQDITERKEIERAKDDLLSREHRIADTLQGALIPSQVPRQIGHWLVAARYLPALREAQVGGDFYDVFKLGEDKIGVLIGDIAGKGLTAAIRVAAVRHSLRSYAYLRGSPAEVMKLTNDALCRDEMDEQNVLTAVFGVIDLAENSITYANAGHEPPVLKTHEGDVVELEVTGPMLGICADIDYAEQTVRLRPGDGLVMFTDGITEARAEGVLLEKQGVLDKLRSVGDATAEKVAEELLQAAMVHAGGDLQDDAAIVVLTCRGAR